MPPYPEIDGGYVCNVAISRYATVELRDGEPHADGAAWVTGSSVEGGPLVAAALRRSGLTGFSARLSNEFPIGAGLGGSSAAGVALQGALSAWRDDDSHHDLAALAERSRDVEVLDLGVAGGRQDHYASAFGGALGLRFTDGVEVERLPLTPRFQAELERRMLLMYTGKSRISGDTITAVIDAYRARRRPVVNALRRMRALAEAMAGAIVQEDADALGAMVSEHWSNQRALHPSISTERIDEIMTRARRAGAIGGKALGASGGGCVVLLTTDSSKQEVQDAIAPLADLLPFGIDGRGLVIDASDTAAARDDRNVSS